MGPERAGRIHASSTNIVNPHVPNTGNTCSYPQEAYYHLLKETQTHPEHHADI